MAQQYTHAEYYGNPYDYAAYEAGELVTTTDRKIYRALPVAVIGRRNDEDILGVPSNGENNGPEGENASIYWEYYRDQPNLGYYQFISLEDLINNLMFEKTGEGTRLGMVNRNKVAFAVQRAIQEFNYDILRTNRSQIVEVNPDKNFIVLPHDFVDEVQISYINNLGQKKPLIKDWNVTAGQEPMQQDDYEYGYADDGNLVIMTPGVNLERFGDSQSVFNTARQEYTGYVYGSVYNDYEYPYAGGYYKRFGSQGEDQSTNGRYVIDRDQGVLYLSGGFNGQEDLYIQIDYVSDGLGIDESEIKVNKLAEEAIYMEVEYRLMCNSDSIQEYAIRRVDNRRRAKTRATKIRLQNLKLGELQQIFRQQSNWLKH